MIVPKQVRYMIGFSILLISISAGCGPAAEEAPDGIQPHAVPFHDRNAPDAPLEEGDMERTENESERGDDSGIEDGVPPLEGGPEETVREPNPVSNSKLQQQYPNTLVLRGSLHEGRVALTFDDGPDEQFTPQVLDILAEHDVPATFFLIGSRSEALPEMTQRIHEEGHAIGNHSYAHPNLAKETVGRMHWEVTQTDDQFEEILGFRTRLFRAPYGALNEDLVEQLAEMNYSVVGWNVDSLDWEGLSAEEVKNNVLSHAEFGSIMLFHSGGSDLSGMIEALPEIITELKEDEIEFVTIPELIDVPEQQ